MELQDAGIVSSPSALHASCPKLNRVTALPRASELRPLLEIHTTYRSLSFENVTACYPSRSAKPERLIFVMSRSRLFLALALF